MIKQQKINLKDLKEEAEKNDCMVRNAIYDRRCYITDGRGIMIATEKGAVIIPIEEATRFVKEFAEMIFKAADILNKLSLEQKNEVARIKKMSYGTLQKIIYDAMDIRVG